MNSISVKDFTLTDSGIIITIKNSDMLKRLLLILKENKYTDLYWSSTSSICEEISFIATRIETVNNFIKAYNNLINENEPKKPPYLFTPNCTDEVFIPIMLCRTKNHSFKIEGAVFQGGRLVSYESSSDFKYEY